MRKEFITELKPGDIFKLNNSENDVNRIVKRVVLEHVGYFPYTLVNVYYAFPSGDCKSAVIHTSRITSTMEKVYKILI